jgi:hypothetical protein
MTRIGNPVIILETAPSRSSVLVISYCSSSENWIGCLYVQIVEAGKIENEKYSGLGVLGKYLVHTLVSTVRTVHCTVLC